MKAFNPLEIHHSSFIILEICHATPKSTPQAWAHERAPPFDAAQPGDLAD
jgi:hypothetical protein